MIDQELYRCRDVRLQVDVILHLIERGEPKAALILMDHLGFTRPDCPLDLRPFYAAHIHDTTWPKYTGDMYRQVDEYQLNLRKVRLELVNTAAEFESMVLELELWSPRAVGVDCQSVPQYRAPAQLSVVTVATQTTVYMIDVMARSQFTHDARIRMSALFEQSAGFKLSLDWSQLWSGLKSVGLPQVRSPLFVDMRRLYLSQFLSRKRKRRGPHTGQQHIVLSEIVQMLLGKTLHTDRKTMWQKRPLTPDSVRYTATRAYALLEVFEAITRHVASARATNLHDLILNNAL